MSAEKSSGVRVVSQVAIEMRNAIVELAGNRAIFDSRQRWLERAARVAGVSSRTAKALFYCETNDPKSSVVDRVREAVEKKKTEDARINNEFTLARREYDELLQRIARCEQALLVHDANFHGPSIDALRGATGRDDRALDQELTNKGK